MSWTTDTCLYIILSDWKQCNSAPKFSSRFIEKENRWAAPWLLSVSDENNSSWEISSSSYWVVQTAATPALDWVAEKFLLHAVTASFYVNDVTVCLLPLAGGILWPICFTVAHYNSMFHQYTLTQRFWSTPAAWRSKQRLFVAWNPKYFQEDFLTKFIQKFQQHQE